MTAILTNPRERERFLKFMVVGGVGFLVDLGTFNLLIGVFLVPAIYAQMVSFTLAVFSNFIWNRIWTYPDSRSKSLSRQLIQFFGVNVAGFAIRTVIFALIENPLFRMFENLPRLPIMTPEKFGHNMALAIVVVIVMLWNFFVNRFWTYNDVS
jgi:putative flippase GtrA